MNKHHPDLFTLLGEFQREQADTEICIQEFNLGRKVKSAPKNKWLTLQANLQTNVANYENYQDKEEYCRLLANNILV